MGDVIVQHAGDSVLRLACALAALAGAICYAAGQPNLKMAGLLATGATGFFVAVCVGPWV